MSRDAATLIDELRTMPSSSLDLRMTIPPEARDPERTFSVEGMNMLIDLFVAWVGARILREIDDGRIPHDALIRVEVTFPADTQKEEPR